MAMAPLPYLWLRPARNGKKIAYYRRGGLYRRICAADGRNLLPGDAGFLDAYAALDRTSSIARERQGATPGSLAALIVEYKTSPEWAELATSTQDDYRRTLDALETKFGKKSVREMPRAAVFEVRKAFATDDAGRPTRSRANKAVVGLRLLMSFAVDRGWTKTNVALRPGRLKTGPGYTAWTEDEFRQFMMCEEISEPIKRAACLAYYTGLRVSDCITLPKSARRGGYIETTPQKTRGTTGAKVWIPEHPELTARLDAAHPSDATTILTRADGRPWKSSNIHRLLRAAVALAGLRPGLSFHGLRKGLTAALAEAGATDAEIDSVIPHADGRMTRYYRKQADQRKLAQGAILKLPREQPGNKG